MPIAPASSRTTSEERSAHGRRDRQRMSGAAMGGGPVHDPEPACGSTPPNDSHYFLVPGLIVLVMTLIGALLTAMVMAREWERGTFEALFVTPVRSGEILLGKTIPYFVPRGARARALRASARSSCSASRFAARSRCCSAPRCSMCWSRSAWGCSSPPFQEPARRQPAHHARDLHAGAHVVGVHVRSAQHAGGHPGHHVSAAGAVLRGAAADRLPGRRHLVRDPAQCGGARAHGGAARLLPAARSPARGLA